MKTYDVRMRCTVIKSVTVECDSEEAARSNPWGNAVDEVETDQVDWDVVSVREVLP